MMKRYLRVAGHKVAELSSMRTLNDVLSDNNKPSFWDPETNRAKLNLKKMIKRLTYELITQHRLKKTHSELTSDNIIFLYNDLTNPMIVNWRGDGLIEDDFVALGDILKEISEKSGVSTNDWDIELKEFHALLSTKKRNLAYLENHYWFHGAGDRFRFFTEKVPSAYIFLSGIDDIVHTPILNIPHGIPSLNLPSESNLLKAYNDSTNKMIVYAPKFRDTLQFLMNYYTHGVEEEGISYKRLEAEVFRQYKSLMGQIFDTLLKLDIAHNFW